MKADKVSPLSPDELSALDGLCALAHTKNSKSNKQIALGKPEGGPPLRLQNLALPARVKAVRVMIAFAAGETYARALAQNGLTAIDFSVIRHQDHDFSLVWEAAKRVKASETALLAGDGLRRLITEDGCELNAKAVMFAAERLAPDLFGKVVADGAGGGSGPNNVYNIIIQGFPQGQPCGNLATNTTSTPVIDA